MKNMNTRFGGLAIILGAMALLSWMAPSASAQYGGLFVSATPQSPITVGQPLNITVTVRNTSDDVWEMGDVFDFSWFIEVYEPSWTPDFDIMYVSGQTVEIGDTVTVSIELAVEDLPTTPGSYEVTLDTVYNWLDFELSLMDGSPKTVRFTINPTVVNHAPTISPIGDKVAVETSLLSFTVSASDSDTPPQSLTFSMLPGAPAGASINSSNGVFTWMPPSGYGPRTNQISVRVTDNGSPAMSATNTFSVVVLPPLRIDPPLAPGSGQWKITWNSFPGRVYRVRYKDDLSSSIWTTLGNDITANGSSTSITNNIATPRYRFYQVLLVQ